MIEILQDLIYQNIPKPSELWQYSTYDVMQEVYHQSYHRNRRLRCYHNRQVASWVCLGRCLTFTLPNRRTWVVQETEAGFRLCVPSGPWHEGLMPQDPGTLRKVAVTITHLLVVYLRWNGMLHGQMDGWRGAWMEV